MDYSNRYEAVALLVPILKVFNYFIKQMLPILWNYDNNFTNQSHILIVLFSLFLSLSISCSGDENTTSNPRHATNGISSSAWKLLAQKKIYFGHRSVGNNIIQGIRDLMSTNPQIRLNIVEPNGKYDQQGGYFVHSRIGHNEPPQSIAREYSRLINERINENVHIALLVFTPFYGKNDYVKQRRYKS